MLSTQEKNLDFTVVPTFKKKSHLTKGLVNAYMLLKDGNTLPLKVLNSSARVNF